MKISFILYNISNFDTQDLIKKLVKTGSHVRAIITKNTKDKPRSFFDNIDKWAKEQGGSGLAYFTIEKDTSVWTNVMGIHFDSINSTSE